jgi:hypothetical protein
VIATECRTIAAALATFSDSACPFMGIETVTTFSFNCGSPRASFPKIHIDDSLLIDSTNLLSKALNPVAERA